MVRFPITEEGYTKICAELKKLKTVERPAIIKSIAEAREHGDLSENAEYHAAREKQSFIETRILEIEDKVARSEVIDSSKMSGDTVKFGATVKISDSDTGEKKQYKIVGEYEADLDSGQLSVSSPIARALISKIKGDFIEVITPVGSKEYKILDVEYK